MLPSKKKQPETINDYISAFPPDTQAILTRLRQRIHGAAPNAREAISYGLPTFKMRGVLVSFGAFKKHIGFYPPSMATKK